MEPLDNACLVAALRDLLNDPTWESQAVTDRIRQFRGYPSDDLPLLEHEDPRLGVMGRTWKAQYSVNGHEVRLLCDTGQSLIYAMETPVIALIITGTRDPDAFEGHYACIPFTEVRKLPRIEYLIVRKDQAIPGATPEGDADVVDSPDTWRS